MRQLISQVIMWIWYASMAAQFVAAAVLARRGLAGRYKALWAFLVLNLAESLWLIWVLRTTGNAGYRSAWTAAQPFNLALFAALTAEAFYLQAKHFRRIRWFGVMLAWLFVALSVLACLKTSGLGLAYWPGAHQRLELLTRYYNTGCLVTLILSVGFFRMFESVTLRPNVNRHLVILALFLSNEILVFGIQYATAARSFAVMSVTQTMSVAIPLACYVSWGLSLTRTGEVCGAQEEVELEEFDLSIEENAERARGQWA